MSSLVGLGCSPSSAQALIAAERAYNRAPRDEAEERYGDYVDLVETGAEAWRISVTTSRRRSRRMQPTSMSRHSTRPCSGASGASHSRSRTADGADRGLRADRRPADRGARRQRRLDRLAVLPALRLRRLLRGAARRAGARALAARAARRTASARAGAATATTRWCWRPSSRPTPGRVRVIDFMPLRGRRRTSCASSRASAAQVAHAHGARHPLRLRLDRPVGAAAPTAACARSPGRTRSACARPVEHAGEDLTHASAEFTVRRGRARAVRAHLVPVARRGRRGRSTPSGAGRHRRAGGELVGALQLRRGRGARRCMRSLITLKALTYAPTGGIVAAADHVAAGADRRRAQLGLPLLLAARRDVHAAALLARAATSRRRAPGATGCCARSPATRRRCRSCTAWPASGGCTELESTGCPATRARRPVRVGNAAAEQFQLDVYGEVIDALHLARAAAGHADGRPGRSQRALLELPRGRRGTSPTRASGRCAARAGTSPTRR